MFRSLVIKSVSQHALWKQRPTCANLAHKFATI